MAYSLRKLLEPDASPRNWLLRHGLYWLLFTGILSFSWIYWMGSFQEALRAVLYGFPATLPLIYGFLYLVLPSLLGGQYRPFLLQCFIWFVVSLFYRLFILHYLFGGKDSQTNFTDNELRRLFDTGFMLTNNFVFLAAALKMFRYQYLKERANQQLAQETLLIELQVLKAQVHPHFLFNTLNNIYSLTLRQAANAPDVIQKLSGLLRYMLHDCNMPLVSLTKEIQSLRDYIELERIRYSRRLTIDMTIDGDLANRQIAPLLLIPFVENAFKHGVSEQTGQTSIDLSVQLMDNELIFRLENSKNADDHRPANLHGGLGLANVRKRLALLYPDRHTLTILPQATRYSVELRIRLNEIPLVVPIESSPESVRVATHTH